MPKNQKDQNYSPPSIRENTGFGVGKPKPQTVLDLKLII